jgi:salicylate hydroxylase
VVNNIAIIGAGVSGLTAGYALRKLGASVDIYERSESVTEFGAGITLSKNATSLLKELGLMDVLLKKGYQPMGSYIRDFKKAKIISYMKFDQHIS